MFNRFYLCALHLLHQLANVRTWRLSVQEQGGRVFLYLDDLIVVAGRRFRVAQLVCPCLNLKDTEAASDISIGWSVSGLVLVRCTLEKKEMIVQTVMQDAGVRGSGLPAGGKSLPRRPRECITQVYGFAAPEDL